MAVSRPNGEMIKMMRGICEALGIEYDMTRRVIIDIPYQGPIHAYVEMYASPKIFTVGWSGGLSGAEVKVLNEA